MTQIYRKTAFLANNAEKNLGDRQILEIYSQHVLLTRSDEN